MEIFGISIDKISLKELMEEITKFDRQNIVFTPNPEILLKTLKDEEFKDLIYKGSFRTSDGIGLYIAYQILNNKHGKIINTILLPYYFFNLFFRRKYLYEKYGERICGSDLTKLLIDFAQNSKTKVVILDLYNPNDAKKVEFQEKFQKLLQEKFPNLIFDYYIYNPEKKDEIIEKISNSDGKILFSTLGMKRQEESIVEVMQKAKNIKLGLGIGSSFDYFIGFQKRAPKIWRAIGIEWLYRLFTGPRKLDRLKRLWNAIFVFSYKVLVKK